MTWIAWAAAATVLGVSLYVVGEVRKCFFSWDTHPQ
jgi:hypothetical protein